MEWYIVKIVMQIICGEGQHRPQFDEQLRLVQAAGLQHAWAKARALGEEQQEAFLNERQEWVRWEFVNVSELWPLEGIEDGLELYYKIIEPEDGEAYVALTHRKAAYAMPR